MTARASLVSVIVPYYDHGQHLHQTVHSALRAYSGPLEIIVVNDGSVEPKAAHYLETLSALSPAVKVIAQTNQGLSGARNTGIAAAKGEFVQLLDSDDMLAPGTIDTHIDHFRMRPELSVSLTNYLLCDHTGSHFRRDGDPITRFDFSLDDFLFQWERGFSIPIHAALFRKEALSPHAFDTSLKGKEDWVFWCGLAAAGRTMSYVPVFGAIYRQHETSMSKSFRKMGESWLAAARTVEAMVPADKREAFSKACQDWHAQFYQPRMRQDALVQPARPGAAAVEAGAAEGEALAWPSASACLSATVDDSAGFSVLVPVYNHYRYLRECLTSILSQETRNPMEIIVVDDASSDPRVAPLLAEFAKQSPNIKVLTNAANLGIAETQNRAMRAASGEFLVFVDCDDALPPGALAEVEKALELDADYLFTDRTDVNTAGKRIRTAQYGGYDKIKPSGDIAADLLDGMVASHLKVIRRQKLLEVGGFDARFGGVQDWEVALKMVQAGARFQYLPRPLYLHRLHGGSVTGADSVRQFWLSNVLRRRFTSANLRPDVDEPAAMRSAKRAFGAATKAVDVFRDLHLNGTAQLKQAWRKGRICAYVLNENALIEEINALREFNSYFDAVLAPNEAMACSMLGYMWDHSALVLAGEAIEAPTKLRA